MSLLRRLWIHKGSDCVIHMSNCIEWLYDMVEFLLIIFENINYYRIKFKVLVK